MKKIFLALLSVTLATCSNTDEEEVFPRAMPVETIYNDNGEGEPGFYVVKSDFEFRKIFDSNAPTFDFTTRMMLIFISERKSSDDSYEVGGLIEREQNIIFQIDYTPCETCTRDAISKVMIIGTDRSTKPILLNLFTKN